MFADLSLIYLVKDKTWTKSNGLEYLFTGEVDEDGNLCGHGIATRIDASHIKIEGTFLDDREHGVSMSISIRNMRD